MKKKKQIAIITIIIMLLNMFFPYVSLFNNIAYAGTGVLEEYPLIINNLGITTNGSNRILKVEIALVSEATINGFDLQFKVDTSRLVPCNKNTGAATNSIGMITAVSDYYGGTLYTKEYDSSTNVFHILGAEPAGGTDLVENGFVPGEVGDSAIDENGAGYPAYYPVITLSFKVVDDEITAENIPLDVFTLSSAGAGLPTGLKVNYTNGSGVRVSKDLQLGGKGFAEPEKQIESIAIKQEPNNTTYEHGDTIDLTGGIIEITYDDQTTEEIDMTNSGVSIKSGSPADVNNQTVTVEYKGNETTFDITVTDPIESLKISSSMDKIEYNHGDSIDFSGLELTATKKSGATETLTKDSQGVTTSEEQANVNSSTFTQTSAEGEIPVKGKQQINFTYQGKTVTQTIIVNDTITNIAVTSQPNKTIYKYGEDLDLTGAVVEVTLASGAKTDINLPDGSIQISTYNNTIVGRKQNLSVTMGEKVATNTIDVEVYNYVTSSQLTEPTKVDYKYNEELSVVGGRIKLNWADGNVTNVNLTTDMVTGYDKTEIGVQTLTVTYNFNYELSDGQQIADKIVKTYEVQVQDEVESIEITAPTKTEYNHGNKLDLTGGNIKVNYVSGATTDVIMEESMIKEQDGSNVNMSPSNYDITNRVSKILKITYEQEGIKKTIDYPIEIINKMQSIEIQGNPQKEYNVNDEFQDNLSILVNRQTGLPEAIEVTEDMISGFTTDEEGTRTVTITYEENGETKTVEYEYTVKDKITSVVLKTQPNKTEYEYGDNLDLTGATLEVTKGSGKTTIPVTQEMITGYDANKLGEQNLTVTHEGIEVAEKINVTVNDKVTGIELTAPNKTKYEIGDQLDLTGGKITTIMASGAKGQEIELIEDMVKGFDSSTEGEKELTVTYGEFSEKYTITVSDEIKGIDLEGTPKTEYIYGEEFDISDLDLIIHKSSGDVKVPVTQDMIKGYDKTQEGEQKVTIEYEGQVVTEINVNVKNPVQKLEWITEPKKAYVIKEELDVTGGRIKATKVDGTYEEITLTQEMVTGYNPDKLGVQTLTVTYEGQTLTYTINVTDKAQSIVIVEEPKKDYLYGEELVAGGKIEVTKLSGEKETINITLDMISGYNPNKLGNQTLTVSYGGVETTYEVNVKDYVKDVVITPPSKIEYNYGEDLDLTDAIITKVMASTPDKSETIPVTTDMISGYNPQVVGAQTVTITYTEDGKKYTQNFGVTVADTIKSVTLQDTGFKTQYLYGENLNLNGLTLNINYSSGRTENIPVTSGMIEGYNPNQIGTQTLTITYKGFTQNKEVDVKDYVEDIILTPPTKKEYKIGETLSLVGGSITEKMASGTNGKVVSLSQDMVKGFDSTTPGVKTITVTYNNGNTFNKTFQVAVINTVNHIEVIPPTKTNYKYGETLNLAGGSIKVVMDDGTVSNVPMTQDMVTGYQKTTPGQQMLTVTYTDENNNTFTGYFNVTVGEDYIVKYQFTAPTKKEYNIGETIDLTGGAITEVYASGKLGNKIELTSSMISGFDSTTPGTKNITVTYNGNNYYYTVVVNDKVLGISIKDLPNKLEYKQGENLDLTGATLNVVKTSGASVINITNDMVSGYNPNQTGIQTITVTYEGFTAEFNVYVKKASTTPSTPEDNTPEDKPNIPSDGDDNKDIPSDEKDNITNNGTKDNNTTSNKTSNITEEEEVLDNVDENQELYEDTTDREDDIGAIIGSTNDDDNNIDSGAILRTVLNLLAGLFALAGIALIIIVIAKDRKNVKIYLEEGEQRVLVGKEKVTKNQRVLDLNKYYNKYKEEEYKIVLSKSISKKLDKKTVNLIVHDKEESFTVDYNKEAYTFKT